MKEIKSPEEFLQQVKFILKKVHQQETRIQQMIENGDLEDFIEEILGIESPVVIELKNKEERRALIREILRLLALKNRIPTVTRQENFYYLTINFIFRLFKQYNMQITYDNHLEIMAMIQERRRKDRRKLKFL